jgi:hypothetical protein
MGRSTEKLNQLRPVTFTLKDDSRETLRYGLIAEEVAKVYPELVLRGVDGKINGVRYEELAPMLLNEVQQQQKEIAEQKASMAAQAQQLQDVLRQLAELKEMTEAAKKSSVRLPTEERQAEKM